MKLTNENAFKKHLKDASLEHLAPIFLVVSKDASDQSKLADAVVCALKEKNANIAVGRFEDGAADNLLDELQAFSLFSQKRVLLLGDTDKLNKAQINTLTDYFLNPNPLLYLVMSCSTVNRGTKFYKNLEKSGIVADLSDEKPWDKEKRLVEHVLNSFKSEGIKIQVQYAAEMIKQLGTDQTFLDNEISKLISYLGDRREVAKKDIETICSTVTHDTIWHLGDALFTGDVVEALNTGKAHIADGVHMIPLLRQIRSLVQSKFRISSILASGGTQNEVSEAFPYMRGAILQRNIDMARGYGIKRFRQAMLDIDKAEFSAKNSVTDPELLLETLIMKLVK